MGGLFKSKSKSTTTSSVDVPQNFQSFLDTTLSKSLAAGSQGFNRYTAPRISILSANEQAGITAAGQQAGMYQPLVDMAAQASGQMLGQRGVPTQQDLAQFTNPYINYVLGNSLDRLQEQSDINMTKLGSQAAMSGAFGGLRQGVLEGANLAELLKSARDLSASTYSDAFNQGMGNWFRSQDLQRGNISDALNVARQGQAYNVNDIQNLMQTGLVGRTRDQAGLDFAYSEFLREEQDPMQKAGFLANIAQAYPRDLFTRTTQTKSESMESPFKQIAGIALAAAGVMAGPEILASLGVGASSLGAALPAGTGAGLPPNVAAKGGLIKDKKVKRHNKYYDGGMVRAGLSLAAGEDPLDAIDRYNMYYDKTSPDNRKSILDSLFESDLQQQKQDIPKFRLGGSILDMLSRNRGKKNKQTATVPTPAPTPTFNLDNFAKDLRLSEYGVGSGSSSFQNTVNPEYLATGTANRQFNLAPYMAQLQNPAPPTPLQSRLPGPGGFANTTGNSLPGFAAGGTAEKKKKPLPPPEPAYRDPSLSDAERNADFKKRYMAAMGFFEGRNNYTQMNDKGGSAFGRYQFMPGTWNDLAPRLGIPLVDTKKVLDPKDKTRYFPSAEEQDKVADLWYRQNQNILKKAGFNPYDKTNMYQLHIWGGGGGPEVLKAYEENPQQKALPVFKKIYKNEGDAKRALRRNTFDPKTTTIGDILEFHRGKLEGSEGADPGGGYKGNFYSDKNYRMAAPDVGLPSYLKGSLDSFLGNMPTMEDGMGQFNIADMPPLEQLAQEGAPAPEVSDKDREAAARFEEILANMDEILGSTEKKSPLDSNTTAILNDMRHRALMNEQAKLMQKQKKVIKGNAGFAKGGEVKKKEASFIGYDIRGVSPANFMYHPVINVDGRRYTLNNKNKWVDANGTELYASKLPEDAKGLRVKTFQEQYPENKPEPLEPSDATVGFPAMPPRLPKTSDATAQYPTLPRTSKEKGSFIGYDARGVGGNNVKYYPVIDVDNRRYTLNDKNKWVDNNGTALYASKIPADAKNLKITSPSELFFPPAVGQSDATVAYPAIKRSPQNKQKQEAMVPPDLPANMAKMLSGNKQKQEAMVPSDLSALAEKMLGTYRPKDAAGVMRALRDPLNATAAYNQYSRAPVAPAEASRTLYGPDLVDIAGQIPDPNRSKEIWPEYSGTSLQEINKNQDMFNQLLPKAGRATALDRMALDNSPILTEEQLNAPQKPPPYSFIEETKKNLSKEPYIPSFLGGAEALADYRRKIANDPAYARRSRFSKGLSDLGGLILEAPLGATGALGSMAQSAGTTGLSTAADLINRNADTLMEFGNFYFGDPTVPYKSMYRPQPPMPGEPLTKVVPAKAPTVPAPKTTTPLDKFSAGPQGILPTPRQPVPEAEAALDAIARRTMEPSPEEQVAETQPQAGTTTVDALNQAVAQNGSPGAPIANQVNQTFAKDKVTSELDKMMQEMMLQRLQEMRQPPKEDKLFGLFSNVNKPLVELGLRLLATPGDFGTALGKAGLETMNSQEEEILKKQEDAGKRLQQLVNMRYMKAQIESLDPNVKLQLAREAAIQKAMERQADAQVTLAREKALAAYQDQLQRGRNLETDTRKEEAAATAAARANRTAAVARYQKLVDAGDPPAVAISKLPPNDKRIVMDVVGYTEEDIAREAAKASGSITSLD